MAAIAHLFTETPAVLQAPVHLQLGGPGAKVMSSSAATSMSLSSHKTNSDIALFARVEDHVARQARKFCMVSVYH